MDQTIILDYIARLPFTEYFAEIAPEVQEKIMFGASEMLRHHYGSTAVITDELIALQTIYLAEGEKEEFTKFKRHNVTSMQVEDISFSFDKTSNNISPQVLRIVEREQAEAKAAESNPIFGSWF